MFLAAAWGSARAAPRVAIGGILHESNSFSTLATDRAAFERSNLKTGDAILAEWGESQHEVGGFIAGARKFGLEIYPALVAEATPAGPVTDAALNSLTDQLAARLRAAPQLDGLLLALHGAMVTEKFPHADAEIVRRLRQAMGPNFPIVVTHDFHANISPEIVRHSTALLTYKTCPHVDQRERGVKAAEILDRILNRQARPTQALAKPPMVYNIRYHNTSLEPLAPIVEESRRLEQNPKILAASVSAGYQYADVPQMGPSVVVVTDNDPALAQAEAQRLSDLLWASRERMKLELPEAAAAVRQAMVSAKTPVVLVDMGDNIGGGSAGDSTFLLAQLLRQNAQGWVVVLSDPEAVEAAVHAVVGGLFRARVGGKRDRLHGDAVEVSGRVRLICDGKYVETEVRHGGRRYHNQGLTALVEVEGGGPDSPNLLMLTTEREPPFSLQQLLSAGIQPQRQKILVVKAAVAFRAAYEPIAGEIIEVDTPGLTAVNPARFTYKKVRRPLWGLE
ncbi:MAG: M81 family metallopeptidase [Acidobacteria bacterium]|nr:M81 family metallopeptidase [Acidobacteriota bacterium]